MRQDYEGQIFLEVVLLAGINDMEKELEGLKTVIDDINPEKIQLNTVVRPPSDKRAMSVDRKRLEDIKVFFGQKAEIVAGAPVTGIKKVQNSLAGEVIDMIRRRPLKRIDIANSLELSMEDVDGLVKGLLIKGYIRKQEHSGETYYLSNEKDSH